MRFHGVSIQNFRNIPLASLAFDPGRQFVLGGNGEGKTSLLEALAFVTALRSFRTQTARSLIRWGEKSTRLLFTIEHETLGETEVVAQLEAGRKTVTIDGENAGRFADFAGRFPTVVFSSQDILLLRGSPRDRRRFLDFVLAAMDAEYFAALRRYHLALKNRNKVLKERGATGLLAAFEREMAPAGAMLVARRKAGLEALRAALQTHYAQIAQTEESPALDYRPDLNADDPDEFLSSITAERPRDIVLRTTSRGPHRDDFSLRLFSRTAREYASEGQQRGLVIALRLAQSDYFRERSGVKPVILADDILGELDPTRRDGFWRGLQPGQQVIATGTVLPSAPDAWQFMQAEKGAFRPCEIC